MRLSVTAALLLSGLVAVVQATLTPARAASADEKRFALVIGNGDYAAGRLPTAANDAGLIAQTLQAAGFDVVGARDLDVDSMRHTLRDFTEKVSAAGPGAVAYVYLAGYGLQYEGDNYFAGIDARIVRDVDVPAQALRVSDFTRPLEALQPKALVVVMDAARDNPFAKDGNPLAGGLALVEPRNGAVYAFNAAPGTIAPPDAEPYGVYAQALAEMMREGGLTMSAVFDRVRLRVNDTSHGAFMPWNAGRILLPISFFERAPDAPRVEASELLSQTRVERPIREFSEADEAYYAAVERDSLRGYLDYLDAFPESRHAKRVRAIVAARREAITWRRTRAADSPNAYWSYLDRYPEGPHAWDARRRLDYLRAELAPPPSYTAFYYEDLPPPPPDEYFYVRRRYGFYYGDPVFAFYVPPPCPIFFLPPPPPPFFFGRPPPPVAIFVLPVPVYVPVAVYVRQAPNVQIPIGNVIAANLHQPIAAVAPAPAGAPSTVLGAPGAGAGPSGGRGVAAAVGAGVVAGAAAGVIASRVALPPSLVGKTALGSAPATGAAVRGSGPGSGLKALPTALPAVTAKTGPATGPVTGQAGATVLESQKSQTGAGRPQGSTAKGASILKGQQGAGSAGAAGAAGAASANAQAQAQAAAAAQARATQAADAAARARTLQASQTRAAAAQSLAAQNAREQARAAQAAQGQARAALAAQAQARQAQAAQAAQAQAKAAQAAQAQARAAQQQQRSNTNANKVKCGVPNTPPCH